MPQTRKCIVYEFPIVKNSPLHISNRNPAKEQMKRHVYELAMHRYFSLLRAILQSKQKPLVN
jgi:hypothetical protein